MDKQKELNIELRSAIYSLHSKGKSERIIDQQLKLSKTTVHDIIK